MIHFTKIFNFLVFLCTLVSSSRMRGWRGYLLMEASFIQATFLLKRQIVAEKEPRLLSKKSFWLRDPTWVDNESRSQLEFDNFCLNNNFTTTPPSICLLGSEERITPAITLHEYYYYDYDYF